MEGLTRTEPAGSRACSAGSGPYPPIRIFRVCELSCISRIFYIGDLRPGQFRDLPITYMYLSHMEKLECLKYLSDLFKSFRIMLSFTYLSCLREMSEDRKI